MNQKSIFEYLYTFGTSSQYNQPIKVNNKFKTTALIKTKYEYTPTLQITQIFPPSIEFSIDQSTCLSMIKKDIEKSRKSKLAFLVSNGKSNNLCRSLPGNSQEDLGNIQSSENCLCVLYGLIKDNADECAKQIGIEVRSCLARKYKIFGQDNENGGAWDEITKEVYQKYRLFLIFDCKSNSEKVLANSACFFPNIKFNIQKIKTSQNIKYSPNQILKFIKEKKINNTYGFTIFDKERRLLLIKKDDPELSKQFVIGLWIAGSFPLKPTRKELGKDDAIWQALYDFYTNEQITQKVSVVGENKGLLCYFSINKAQLRPQLYLIDFDNKSACKWSFLTQSQYVVDWNKSLQIKFNFPNTTIMQQREYSQFSDQTYNEEPKLRSQNINRQNIQSINLQRNSSQKIKTIPESEKSDRNSEQIIKDKDNEIAVLKKQLEIYKAKCIELQAMNKMLIQEKMMNQMMYMNPMGYQMQSPVHNYAQYPYQTQGYHPLSYSQISNFQQPQQETSPNSSRVKKQAQLHAQRSPRSLNYNENQSSKGFNEPKFSFKEQSREVITFSQEPDEDEDYERELEYQQNKPFVKKKSSQEEQIRKQSEKLKANSETIRQIFVKQDAKNISFQDSFVNQRSDDQKQEPDEAPEPYSEEQKDYMRSPQFKRNLSEDIHYSGNKIQQPIKQVALESKAKTSLENTRNIFKEESSQPQKFTKKSSLQVNIAKKYKIDNSDEEEPEQKTRPKNKKKTVLSDSDDSDQNVYVKNITSKYLGSRK